MAGPGPTCLGCCNATLLILSPGPSSLWGYPAACVIVPQACQSCNYLILGPGAAGSAVISAGDTSTHASSYVKPVIGANLGTSRLGPATLIGGPATLTLSYCYVRPATGNRLYCALMVAPCRLADDHSPCAPTVFIVDFKTVATCIDADNSLFSLGSIFYR